MTIILKPTKFIPVINYKGLTTGGIGYIILDIDVNMDRDILVAYDCIPGRYICDRNGRYYGYERERDLQ